MSKYDDLVKKLKEIFQIDRPELDFGIYRILNSRVGEINDYLENSLKAKVGESLAASGAANVEGLQKELKEKETQYRADGIDPDTVPKVRELRKKLEECGVGKSEHENTVFTHLLTFFSRYYDKGDFISQRRYKGDTYAIPYAGEEVVLHWANKDQYYTKSGENFSNYGFKLDDGRTVRFRLVTADTAKDNRKDNDKDRRFVLIEPHTRILTDDEGDEYEEEMLPVEVVNGELVLRFEYKSMPKGSKQDTLVLDAVSKVLGDANVKARWLELSKREPTEKNPQRTLLEKCLTNYTTKNTADYFIHKDLGCFLRRELDFYIKNEVMHLDDVQNAEKFADIEKNLRLIQTLRSIALDLITFLAQLEDFQRKLWLKKKFVVAAHYCITLDRVPESLYPVIAANPQQWEQWDNFGMLDGSKEDLFNQTKAGSVEFLKAHPSLMVDTTIFDAAFKNALLATVDNLDESLDGLLIHGDNFQALNLLQERYRGQVKCVYIDPPYNTDANAILYKNSYKHSSWLALMLSRIEIAKSYESKESSVSIIAIDQAEQHRLYEIYSIINSEKTITTVSVIHNPGGTMSKNLTATGEFALFAYDDSKETLGKENRADNPDIRDLMNTAKGSAGTYLRSTSKTSFYPVFVKDMKIIGFGDICDENFHPKRNVNRDDGIIEVYPIDNDGVERKWVLSRGSIDNHVSELNLKVDKKTGVVRVERVKSEINYKTIWTDGKYSAKKYGTELLGHIIPITRELPPLYPKSIHLVKDCLHAATANDFHAAILDYFAGSGTTGHAVINLNREDKEKGKRKYILVEQGEYFDTVLKPRIQKVVYSADWKDGKATAPQTGISHAFKVIKLESYEDTLNNLQLRRTTQQQDLLDTLPQSAKEDYLLRYLLDIESRGSLLSVEQFNKPFDCKLKVTIDSAGAYEERTIDLVETFNYLIGLRVRHIDMQMDKGFVLVMGWLPTGEKTLVLWRDVEKVDYETLNRLCDKLAINPADSEFDVVYINGDHNIPAVFASTEAEGGITKTLKLRQIEPEFLSRMFAVEGV